MIKSIFINSRIKKNLHPREHDTYLNAERIGILYNADEFNQTMIEEAKHALEQDRKFVSKLGFTNIIPKEPNKLPESEFTRKDISVTGSIKKENVAKFIEKPFDFLLTLDTSANINLKHILASSKAICKIGFEAEEYQNLLLMSLKLSDNKPKAVKDLISYLKKI